MAVAKPAINSSAELLPGLSGNSWLVTSASTPQVIRTAPLSPLPFVNRQREYRILKKLANTSIGVLPIAYQQQQLSVQWIPGQPLQPEEFVPSHPPLIRLLIDLPQQPLFGYRLLLLPLLEQYWQLSQYPNLQWLRCLKRLRKQREPAPLRLVPLHMDLHPGNVIATDQGLRLIDWEYAADGDIALEITSLTLQNPQHAAEWIRVYSEKLHIDQHQLRQQVTRWTPWLELLQASWYQLKAEQTQQKIYQRLANQYWQMR